MADRPPSSRGYNRELWVGLFVLVGIITTVALLMVLTDPTALRGRYNVFTVIPDAGGIRKGDPVRMLGVVIGRVMTFQLEGDKVRVRLEIEGEYEVPEGSRIIIRSKSMFGEKVADVLPGPGTTRVKEGTLLPGELEVGLFENTEGLSQQATDVMKRTQRLLSDETVQNVETSTAELKTLMSELSKLAIEQRRELSALSKSLRKSSEALEAATTQPELKAAIKRTETVMARMQESSESLKRSTTSLETVMTRLEQGEGTLGKLMKDETLYNNLNEAAANTSKLMEDIRKQPRRYVKLSFF
jgi:phospholipid/cholesterol/gamma-HCH transport system substrate-binding protein